MFILHISSLMFDTQSAYSEYLTNGLNTRTCEASFKSTLRSNPIYHVFNIPLRIWQPPSYV